MRKKIHGHAQHNFMTMEMRMDPGKEIRLWDRQHSMVEASMALSQKHLISSTSASSPSAM